MAERLIFITGGARSGKSSYALSRAENIDGKRLFIATCPDIDGEMAERVKRHQLERQGRGWSTIETQTDLAGVLRRDVEDYHVVLIDCMTLWVNNILFHPDYRQADINDYFIARVCRKWLKAADTFSGTLLCVSNEVGLGIVPDNALARKYRDLVGTCNQLIAQQANEVVLVSCGLPLHLKNESIEIPNNNKDIL